MHEFHVIENGKRALTLTRDHWRELSLEESKTVGFEGRCKVMADGIEELDITVDPPRVLFKWVGIEHIPLNHSVQHYKQERVNEECSGNWDIQYASLLEGTSGMVLISSTVISIRSISLRMGTISSPLKY